MSITQLLHSPLTVPQTQQATALNDLLCYTAINDGHISWDELPKATSTVSYEALYEVILDGAGRKSSLCARVEYAERYFQQHDFTKTTTAGIPNPLFHSLVASWKAHAVGEHCSTSIFDIDSASSSTSTTEAIRVTAQRDTVTHNPGRPLRGLNVITVVLQETPQVSIDDFVRAGINPAVLAKVELFGDWIMMLGPAMLMRKACRACWNVRMEHLGGPAVSSPALLCEDVEEGDELFALCGDESVPCANPHHGGNVYHQRRRRIPKGTFITGTNLHQLDFLFRLDGAFAGETIAAATVQTPAIARYLSESASDSSASSPPSNPSSPLSSAPSLSPPSPIIRKHPLSVLPYPPRKRKLHSAIHRQVMLARVDLRARQLLRQLGRELGSVSRRAHDLGLELERCRMEVSVAKSSLGETVTALAEERQLGKEKDGLLARLKEEEKTVRRSLGNAEEALIGAVRERDEHRQLASSEAARAAALAERISSLESKLRIDSDLAISDATGVKEEKEKAVPLAAQISSVDTIERTRQAQLAEEIRLASRAEVLEHARRLMETEVDGKLGALRAARQKELEANKQQVDAAAEREASLAGQITALQHVLATERAQSAAKIKQLSGSCETAQEVAKRSQATELALNQQILALMTGVTNRQSAYQSYLHNRDQEVRRTIHGLQATIKKLGDEVAEKQVGEVRVQGELERAYKGIAELKAELDDVWKNYRNVQSELVQVRRSVAAGTGGGLSRGEGGGQLQIRMLNGNHMSTQLPSGSIAFINQFTLPNRPAPQFLASSAFAQPPATFTGHSSTEQSNAIDVSMWAQQWPSGTL